MNQDHSHDRPVVILSSGHHGGLGIARSLGRLGVPVYSVDAARWEAAFSSRYCRGRFLLDFEDKASDRPLDGLLAIGRKLGGRPLLIPGTDRETIWAAANSEALSEEFLFPRQDAGLIRTLCDKSRMQELARQCGLPTATSTVPRCRQDIEQFIQTAVFPVIVKATDAGRLRRRTGGTKFLIHSGSELLDLYLRAEDGDGPNFLIQEFIPGDDWMFDGYFNRDSECLFGITGKKIRRFPAKTGVTSLGVCLRSDRVHQLVRQFMRAIGYRGILDIGFRYDSRDGQYKVLDVNPRIGCSFRLFAGANGMDVARALYLDMIGSPVPADEAEEGRKWIVEDFDLFSALASWREGSLTLKDWAKSLDGIHEAACFAVDDPLPFLMMAVSDCCELGRWLRRLAAVRKDRERTPDPVLLASTRRL
jgi:predicted ATP-grasp superfamily ATP-dependent carboligase